MILLRCATYTKLTKNSTIVYYRPCNYRVLTTIWIEFHSNRWLVFGQMQILTNKKQYSRFVSTFACSKSIMNSIYLFFHFFSFSRTKMIIIHGLITLHVSLLCHIPVGNHKMKSLFALSMWIFSRKTVNPQKHRMIL